MGLLLCRLWRARLAASGLFCCPGKQAGVTWLGIIYTTGPGQVLQRCWPLQPTYRTLTRHQGPPEGNPTAADDLLYLLVLWAIQCRQVCVLSVNKCYLCSVSANETGYCSHICKPVYHFPVIFAIHLNSSKFSLLTSCLGLAALNDLASNVYLSHGDLAAKVECQQKKREFFSKT